MSKNHQCAICETAKAGAIGASSVLVWLGFIPEGAKGYAHPACIKKARADRKGKAQQEKPKEKGQAPISDKDQSPVPVVPAPSETAIPLHPLPPRKRLPEKLHGWALNYNDLGLIVAKKGKEAITFPNISRANDALRPS